jgi:hypothetical protein
VVSAGVLVRFQNKLKAPSFSKEKLMLYKLRNNAFAFADNDKKLSIFDYVRSACLHGASFATALTHEAQELSVIVEKISKAGDGGSTIPATPDRLSVPIEDTLRLLEEYGFVISGETEKELNEKEIAGYRKR